MKRALAWLAGLVGIAALGRWLSRHRTPGGTSAPPPAATTDDPAEELRRRLAEARAAEPAAQAEPTDGPEPATEPEPASEAVAVAAAETLEERRARVHAKAREAIDAMGDDGAAG